MSALNANIGEYRLVDFIGAGGMGEVYRAEHVRLGRVIAIKILNQMEATSVQRFKNEVNIQASLRHPAIAEYYGMHEYNGRPCLLMELVDGESLADRLARGPFPPDEACKILRQVAEAVGYVHSQGIVHRDLKANNIKINSAGRVKLLDFGIARTQRSSRLTRVGMLVGTLESLAPEQVNGGEGDARSDIWALGVLLYEMVTGKMPFEGNTMRELYDQIRSGSYTPPSQWNKAVKPALEHVISVCLEKKASHRYQSAEDLIRALDDVPQSDGRKEGAAVKLDRSRLAIAGALVSGLVVAGLVVHAIDSGSGQVDTQTIIDTEKPDIPCEITMPFNPDADGPQRIIHLNTNDGKAQVYQDGRFIGSTNCTIHAATGDRIAVELRREGRQDMPVSFTVDQRDTYTYTLAK